MGATKSIPVVGETVTIVDSGCKTLAALGCGVAGRTDLAEDYIKSAGESWVDYTDRSLLVAPAKIAYYKATDQSKKQAEVENIFCNSAETVVDHTPVVGHAKGIYHYCRKEDDRGWECMKNSTLTAVVGGAILTGGTSLLLQAEERDEERNLS